MVTSRPFSFLLNQRPAVFSVKSVPLAVHVSGVDESSPLASNDSYRPRVSSSTLHYSLVSLSVRPGRVLHGTTERLPGAQKGPHHPRLLPQFVLSVTVYELRIRVVTPVLLVRGNPSKDRHEARKGGDILPLSSS